MLNLSRTQDVTPQYRSSPNFEPADSMFTGSSAFKAASDRTTAGFPSPSWGVQGSHPLQSRTDWPRTSLLQTKTPPTGPPASGSVSAGTDEKIQMLNEAMRKTIEKTTFAKQNSMFRASASAQAEDVGRGGLTPL
ncbi:hypothetical protein HDU76_006679 [Blyttiomyces sp. JEL0837]|nr:hypothetical protein HDU76_006679 [Blyttiomyces sp. JEL0837]